MPDVACLEAMELLNLAFTTSLILNDGHEILARLKAGDDIAELVEEYGNKFGNASVARAARQVTDSWPPLHVEAVCEMVKWALGKLDTDDRVTINWKGDNHHPETVTRFELRDHTLLIEFAHPPVSLRAAGVSR